MKKAELINEMIEAIMKVAQGDYSVQIEPSGKNDELDSLAMGLNMMIDDIRINHQELKNTQEATLNILDDLNRQSKELNVLNNQLQQEINERKHAEESLKIKTLELAERVKELDVLYAASKILADTTQPIKKVLQDLVELIPQSWQYPEVTCARITFKGIEYKTANFNQTPWGQSVEITLFGDPLGLIEVYYLHERPMEHEGPFLKEERHLLNNLVREISKYIERKQSAEKLKTTLTELERSNKELEQFAYIASHDLQEPLRMVSSYLQLLERRYKDKLDTQAHEFIDFAVDGALRMQNLINDLLTYSRVGTRGKKFESADTENILNKSLLNLGLMIEDTGAVVTHDSLPLLKADDVQLAQLFQNLIGNAIKFHGNESPKIHVSVDKKEKEWVFSVTDNGIGIDPKFADNVFMIFQRLHSKEEYPGTGIGLAVCKRIIEQYNGRIWFESEPGAGTTFYFTIPIMDGD